jgi:hypothetical protein
VTTRTGGGKTKRGDATRSERKKALPLWKGFLTFSVPRHGKERPRSYFVEELSGMEWR